jgi:hypothetical protein
MLGRHKLAAASPPRPISKMGPGPSSPYKGRQERCVSVESGRQALDT